MSVPYLRPALQLIVGQLVAIATLTAIALPVWGLKTATSLLVGGVTGILATASMAIAVMKPSAQQTAGGAARGFLIGWVMKVLVTITLLVIAFRSRSVAPLPLVIGYAATYLGYLWAALRQRPV